MPSHDHKPANETNFVTGGGNGEADICAGPSFNSYSIQYTTDIVGSSASHTHSVNITTANSNNLQPFYAMAYIMRLS